MKTIQVFRGMDVRSLGRRMFDRMLVTGEVVFTSTLVLTGLLLATSFGAYVQLEQRYVLCMTLAVGAFALFVRAWVESYDASPSRGMRYVLGSVMLGGMAADMATGARYANALLGWASDLLVAVCSYLLA